MRVLVTGASGFLGSSVVDALLTRGILVRALVRPATRTDAFAWHDNVELFRADLRGGADLLPAFQNVDALVHLAAVVGSNLQDFAATVTGTDRLLNAMARSQTTRLVLASSFSVYDWRRVHGSLTERSPVQRPPYDANAYAMAKLWQERLVCRFTDAQGGTATILRPGVIWGRRHDDLWGLGFGVGRFQVTIGPTRRLPLTHVDNCADCFAHTVVTEPAGMDVFNVVDGEGTSLRAFVDASTHGAQREVVCLTVPYWVARTAVRAMDGTSMAIFGATRKMPERLMPRTFETLFKPVRYEGTKLRDVLGWRPPLSWAECVQRTYGR